MNKIHKKNKSLLFCTVAIIAAVAIVGIFQIVKAQLEKSQMTELTDFANSVGGDKEAFLAGIIYLENQFGGLLLGGGTRFTNGISTDTTEPSAGEVRTTSLTVTNAASFNATTTLQKIEFGSDLSKALTFTAGATTTPGGLFSIQNTGDVKICSKVTLYFGSDSGDDTLKLQFSVSTSTSATAWSNVPGGLIASTTVATTTASVTPNNIARIYSSETNPGEFFRMGNQGKVTSTDWIWDNGVYVNGAFDYPDHLSASSTAYTSRTGTVNIFCISK
jgi:hypothetical protein